MVRNKERKNIMKQIDDYLNMPEIKNVIIAESVKLAMRKEDIDMANSLADDIFMYLQTNLGLESMPDNKIKDVNKLKQKFRKDILQHSQKYIGNMCRNIPFGNFNIERKDDFFSKKNLKPISYLSTLMCYELCDLFGKERMNVKFEP
jgi:hypothetical protein